MLIEGYIPQKDVSEEVPVGSISTAIDHLQWLHSGEFVVTHIDGKEVEGKCEGCSRFVFSDEEFGSNPEELYVICPECVEKEKQSGSLVDQS